MCEDCILKLLICLNSMSLCTGLAKATLLTIASATELEARAAPKQLSWRQFVIVLPLALCVQEQGIKLAGFYYFGAWLSCLLIEVNLSSLDLSATAWPKEHKSLAPESCRDPGIKTSCLRKMFARLPRPDNGLTAPRR